MNLFGNKKVVGLFDNQKDLEGALADLHKQGFGQDEDDLVVIDKNYLSGENPFMQQGNKQVLVTPTSSSGAGGAVVNAAPMPEDNVSESNLQEKLRDLGVDKNEVNFYAQQVNRGNSLVVVDTDDDQAQHVHDIMRRFNAKSSIS